jgi:hypothetical protein
MEYRWDSAVALEQIQDSLRQLDSAINLIETGSSRFIFEFKDVVMSAEFQGASWKLENPIATGVRADSKLYRSLFEENSTEGNGSWEIGAVDKSKKTTNLWQSKLFWYPPSNEALGFMESCNFSSLHQDYLGGKPAMNHPEYRSLNFHINFYRFEIDY